MTTEDNLAYGVSLGRPYPKAAITEPPPTAPQATEYELIPF